ncbi:MAG: electron transfer flavoprotein subunit alpha/FixB family protein [Schleiferiaceae bacterium]|nr:electron transfer flavoprotein subunit alpha/FixB family protein [Schleiferiaceae bacterium]
MSVIIFAESTEGKFKKATFEACSYGAKIAAATGSEAHALVIGSAPADLSVLGKYGADKVHHASDAALDEFNGAAVASVLKAAMDAIGAKYVVISGSFNGKTVAPILSVKAGAALITNVNSLPASYGPLVVRRSAFSSKGLADYTTSADVAIISIIPNAIGVEEHNKAGEVATLDAAPAAKNTTVVSVDRVKGQIPLPEAELVVSAGRGMKAAENWTLIEKLADTLGAATACSKPVSDMHWRPHTEHVGQTGIAIRPNLYIAIGISGAIQHLAGVSNSKTIVVINSDAEAPFFKAADYGIVGDAFDVVPKLTAAIEAFKASN